MNHLVAGLLLIFYSAVSHGQTIRSEEITKYLIFENDTVIDYIETYFYSKSGQLEKWIEHDPFTQKKQENHYKNDLWWYTLTFNQHGKTDSLVYLRDKIGKLIAEEKFAHNGQVIKSIYQYTPHKIRKDNYEYLKNKDSLLISYEIRESDSLNRTELISYVNISETGPGGPISSQIERLKYDSLSRIISIQNLSNTDDSTVIDERQYLYNGNLIEKETVLFQNKETHSTWFKYVQNNAHNNWTKKLAYGNRYAGSKYLVGYEIRAIEYW